MSPPLLKLFEAAITQAWNAIVITDADIAVGCRVQFANPAFTAMTGYSLDELRGHSLRILQGPDTDPALIDELRICLKEARLFEGTATNYRKDGSSYTVRWSISPVRDDSGLVTNFVSVQQDISDYEQAEQTNRLLARALDATSDPVMLTDATRSTKSKAARPPCSSQANMTRLFMRLCAARLPADKIFAPPSSIGAVTARSTMQNKASRRYSERKGV
jgi:PAS domain S-box-containing protein